ncbi:hypothetical protein CJ030_MR3G026069 [Morella rubra]|uniref:Thioredoxin-like fold domain-containing protein MRL7L, chloroplastic n=1 Tax=Morella rubra TaxID=262757 RepID=A0A6A1VYZ8_9ROSI|nr:hypothetical protein CJ030_MR3G026069 [Morella rubra]
MALQRTIRFPLPCLYSPINENKFRISNSVPGSSPQKRRYSNASSSRMECLSLSANFRELPLLGRQMRTRIFRAFRTVGDASTDSDEEDDAPSGKVDDPHLMDAEERREWRSKIREVMNRNPDVEEEVDPEERRKKMQKLLAEYPLVVDEDDPEWPEDADGWGFSLGQFFDKITIKNNKKGDDDNNDSDDEIVWKDDNYIRPIRDITTAEWEEAVFKDISPLIILVHNRYKSVLPLATCRGLHMVDWHISKLHGTTETFSFISDQGKMKKYGMNWKGPTISYGIAGYLHLDQCVAIDAVVEVELVSALKVSVFPEMIFTKAGKILYREKGFRTADELSKIMAFFYYGAGKPPCLGSVGDSHEAIPSVPIKRQVC